MKVEVTLEKTQRVAMVFDATEEQLEALRNGENPFQKQMETVFERKDEIDEAYTEYDYAVNDLSGNEIVPWS